MTLAACVWLRVFPLLNFGSYTSITLDKWRCMVALTGGTIGCRIADGCAHRTRRPEIISRILAGPLLIWMVVSCLASGAEPFIWWEGRLARREGLVTQTVYIGLFFLFSRGRVKRKALLGSTAAGVLVFGLIVMVQKNGGNPFHLFPRGTSILTNPEFQGTIGNVDMCTGYLVSVFGILATDLLLSFRDKRSEMDREKRFSLFLLLLWAGAGMAPISDGIHEGSIRSCVYGRVSPVYGDTYDSTKKSIGFCAVGLMLDIASGLVLSF